MLQYKDKTIGKSKYHIDYNGEYFSIWEVYNGTTTGKDSRHFRTLDDAFAVLSAIDRERFYTDPFYSGGITI